MHGGTPPSLCRNPRDGRSAAKSINGDLYTLSEIKIRRPTFVGRQSIRWAQSLEADQPPYGPCVRFPTRDFSRPHTRAIVRHGRPVLDIHMERFVRRENIRHYRELLERVTDEAERRRILKLLEEEQRKQHDAGDKADC